LHGGPMFIQVGSSSRHGKGSLVPIFPGQSDGAMECNPSAPALSQLNAIQVVGGGSISQFSGFQ
jgi:hypothetical protein